MTRFSRNRIIAAAGLGEHIPLDHSGRFENIEVEQGITTTLILKAGKTVPGQGKPRRVYLVCHKCREEILLGYWDRHQHAHSMHALDTDKPHQEEEEKGDV